MEEAQGGSCFIQSPLSLSHPAYSPQGPSEAPRWPKAGNPGKMRVLASRTATCD